MENIRKASGRDKHILITLWNELVTYHQRKKNYFPIAENWRGLKERELEWILEGTQSVIYVVEIEDMVVGYARGSIRKIPQLYDIGNEGNIEEIYIIPAYRKNGLGTKLVNTMMKEFKSRAIDFIQVHVDIENEAGQKFWSHVGFESVSVCRRHRLEGEEKDEFSLE